MSSTYTVTESYDMAETSMELIARFDRAENTSSKSSQSNGGDGILARALAAATSVEQAASTHLTKKVRKKALEVVGPAMLVLTFIEDGLRIPLRWSEQLNFLTVDRGFAQWLSALLLVVFCATQLAGAFFIVRPKHYEPSRVKLASYSLLAFTAVQPFVYGTHADADFMSRALTLSGGLLLLVWGEKEKICKRNDLMSMSVHELDDASSDRLQLAGRLLLTFLFLFQAVHSEHGGLHTVLSAPSAFNVLVSSTLILLSLMTCVGFHTEWSSIGLTAVLGLSNFAFYPFWSAPAHLADFYRYYFFQTLSVMGGLLLLTLHGPGGLSLDGKQKKAI